MEELITISLGLGLATSLVFSEMLGVAAGGMVVPGYVALRMNEPFVIFLTLFASFLTYFIVHSLGNVMILYGRRRTVLMILVGFIIGWLIRSLGPITLETGSIDLTVVGYIIPGLIAIWMDRQGIIETFSALITASVIIRLALILITKGEVVI